MTEQKPESAEPRSQEHVQHAVRSALESGEDIRERVRRLVVDLARGARGPGETAREAVRSVWDASTNVARRSAPETRDGIMRDVIDGIVRGVETIAQATTYAVREAGGRGERFAREDLDIAAKDLETIGEVFVETVTHASDRLGTELGSGARELKGHAERAVAAVRPALGEAARAIRKDPAHAVTEAATTAVRGSRLAVGALLGAVSGALAGAAELLEPGRSEERSER